MKDFERGIKSATGFFALRDDDISYFTSPSMLETLYGSAWKQGFKPSLAIIPKRKIHGKSFSIAENRELVQFIKTKIDESHVDVIQHGYAHSTIADKAEFQIRDFRRVDRMLAKGRAILEKTFDCQISVFSAPHDAVSRATLRSLQRRGLCLCRRFTLGRLLAVLPPERVKIPYLVKAIARSPNPFRLVPDTRIEVLDTPIIQWTAILSPRSSDKPSAPRSLRWKEAKRLFAARKNRNQPFVLLHHHWEYFGDNGKEGLLETEGLRLLNAFLSYVSKTGVAKTSLSEVCEGLACGS
ncbi:MAG: DUF2334 domain-containing protein [Candidatus Bathyarchaeota archaeon]|nr:MAG: DUF2334 domain-containing protein [Candidatus Bathyarchaeota archaeon]